MTTNNRIRTSLLLFIFTCFLDSKTSFAADYYWVGGTGNWSDLNHWATASGGTVQHPQIPTANDNVIFDAVSFSAANQVVTVNVATAFCRDMAWTGVTNTPVLRGASTAVLSIYGSLTLVAGMTYDFGGDVQFQSTTTNNRITAAGKIFKRNLIFDNTNGEWTFQDAISVDSTIHLRNGILRMAGATVNAERLFANSTNSATIDFADAVVILRGRYAFVNGIHLYTLLIDPVRTRTGTGGTHTIRCTSPDAWVQFSEFNTFTMSPLSINALEFTATTGKPFLRNSSGSSIITINRLACFSNASLLSNKLTINTLQLTNGKNYDLESGQIYPIQNLQATAVCTAPILIRSTIAGVVATLSSNQNINAAFVTIQDIVATGGGAFTANNATGVGTTTGWTINQAAAQTLFWVGGTGNWNDIAHWSTTSGGAGGACLPTANDNVTFDANSMTGGTVTINVEDAFCKNLNWTNASGATLTGAFAHNLHVFGSFNLVAGMNWTFGGRLHFETALADQDIQTANKIFQNDVIFNGAGGWILRGDMRTLQFIRYFKGSWHTNSQYVRARGMRSESTQIRNWTLGDSKIELFADRLDTYIMWINAQNLTLDAGRSEFLNYHFASNLYVDGQSGTAKFHNVTFLGLGQAVYTYNNRVTLGFNKLTFTSIGTSLTGTMSIDTLVYAPNSDNLLYDATSGSSIGAPATYRVKAVITPQNCNVTKTTIRRANVNGAVTMAANGVDSVVLQNVIVVDVLGTNMVANNSRSIGNTAGWTIRRGNARTLYWVGNTGEWFDPAHWSLTSGGAGGACVPTLEDDVFFDANSFSIANQRVRQTNDTISFVQACRNMDWTGVRFNPHFAGSNIQIHGSIRYAPMGQMSVTAGQRINFLSENPFNVDLKGHQVWSLEFNSTSVATQQSPIYTSYFYQYKGNFLTQSQDLTIEYWASIGNLNRTTTRLVLDNSFVWFKSGYNPSSPFYAFNILGDSTFLDAGTSRMQFDYEAASIYLVARQNAQTRFHNVLFNNPTGLSRINGSQVGSVFFNRLQFLGNGELYYPNTMDTLIFSAGRTYKLVANQTQTVNKYFQMVGNNCESIRLQSLTTGQKATVTMNSGSVLANFVQMSDQAAVGSIAFLAGANSTNIGNSNTGWRFESPANFQNVGFLGRDTMFCDNTNFLITAYASPIATYRWSTGATTPTITVNQAGAYSAEVTFGNSCVIRDTVLVERVNTPIFDLGNDTVLCRNQTLTLRLPNPTGAILTWQDGAMTPQYIVSQAGIYRGEVNLRGCKSQDSIRVSYIDGASFSLGNDTILCAGGLINYNFAIAGASFRWQDGATTPQYRINRGGTFWLEVTANGCNIRDSITVGFIDPGTFTLGRDTTLCENQTLRLRANLPNATFRWQDGSTDSTFTVRNQGQYSVAASVAQCRVSDTISVNFTPLPRFSLGNDTSLCAGQNLNFNFNLANTTYRWNDGRTTPQYQIANAGTFWLETTASGCAFRDSVQVGIIDLGTINLGRDTAVCESQTVVLRASSIHPNAVFSWQDGSVGATFTVRNQGQYAVLATVAQCQKSDTIQITVNPKPNFDLGLDTTLCENQTLNLNATAQTGATYRWQNGSTLPNLTVLTAGMYRVTATLGNCTTTDSVSINYNPLPNLTLGNDTTICESTTYVLRPLSNATNFRWQDGSNLSSFNVAAAGTFIVEANLAGCRRKDTIVVGVTQLPRFDLGKDTLICQGKNHTLTANPQNATIRWNNNATTLNLTVGQTGTYTAEATRLGCTFRDSIKITFAAPPQYSLGKDTLICEKEPLTLKVNVPNSSYLWSDSSARPSLLVEKAGIYWVEVTTNAGCKVADSIVVQTKRCPVFEPFIPNVFTPNADQINDQIKPFFQSEYKILAYEFEIYSRWGNVIFRTNDINAAWDGTFQGVASPNGVYVFRLKVSYEKLQGGSAERAIAGDFSLIR